MRLMFRFQHWVIAATTLLVMTLTVAFLFALFRTVTRISEDSATAQFSLIAGHASGELESLILQESKFVATQARSDRSQFVIDGQLNPHTLVPVLLAALDSAPNVYSHFFGLGNDEFLQVIGTRDDARINAALRAPAGTYYAVRRITLAKSGMRRDHYAFLNRAQRTIGEREQAAQLVPTQRPWYVGASQRDDLFLTAPYPFASTGELGVTVAAPLPDRLGVFGTDINLRTLQGFLGRLALPPNGAIAVQDMSGKVLAFQGRGRHYADAAVGTMADPQQITAPYLDFLRQPLTDGAADFRVLPLGPRHEDFVLAHHYTRPVGGTSFRLQIWAPLSDFTGVYRVAQRNVLIMSLLVLLVTLPLAYLGSRQIARTLAGMAAESERLKMLDFSHKPSRPDTMLYEINALGDAQVVMHEAIQKRTEDLRQSQEKLARLVDNGIRLSREQDRTALLRHILFGAREIGHCMAATLFLKTEHNTLEFVLRTSDDHLPSTEISLYDAAGKPNEQFVVVHSVVHNQSVVIDDVYSETRFDLSGTKRFSEESGLRTVSMLTVPLSPREGEVIGVIQLLNALDPDGGRVIPFDQELVGFVEALAAQSAVALENQNLIEAQKAMMESLIQLIAGSIDAKSPYTGGHCARVPELGMMLAEAASAVSEGPLADFRFRTEDEWREFRIGAWLHDCGKVTTPEYVVDKATKLETIYNRIHEIRMRFEVLLRDERIRQLEAVASGEDPVAAQARFDARKTGLADDFAFVAECNLGGEFMAPERIERLQRIAQTVWLRHFDDRLGLAQDELRRYPAGDPLLPATEQLLADKPQHIIPRTQWEVADPRWGFKVKVPDNLYDHGEIHNLSIGRGTLTEEERFKVNEHVMHSLMMLEQLPLPKNLRRVPEYAGTHHETLLGTGYPRKLGDKELTVPMRIMAIADIFEALTASDRPYKKAKTLSESVRILHSFKQNGHIDPVLFDLFLTSGIYRRYADKFMPPEYIDEVDIQPFLG